MAWPQFARPQPLGDARVWTAIYDSFDQRNDNCYYCVRLFDGDRCTKLIAEISVPVVGDAEAPEFVDALRGQLATIAASGKTNTAYAGYTDRWTPTDLESYRAAHRSVGDAILHCDRPDWMLELAFESSDRPKDVIERGAAMASALEGGLTSELGWLLPWPTQLEAIETWVGHSDNDPVTVKVRAKAIGIVAACILVLLGDQLIWGAQFDEGTRVVVELILISVLGSGLMYVARWVWLRSLRRQVAQLDGRRALDIVLASISARSARRPWLVPFAMYLGRELLLAYVGAPKPPFREFGIYRHAYTTRRWTARWAWTDAERNVCTYRVTTYNGKQRSGELLAEVSTVPKGSEPTVGYATLHHRIDDVVATGTSNATERD